MRARPVADVIEDLEFLDGTGVGATDAAVRTDFPSAHAMEKWLDRHGRSDLWQSLKHRDPAGTHLSGSDRKKRSLMSVPTEPIDTIARLITEAQGSTRARTRKKADRLSDLVADLRSTLTAEREDDERREKARKDIERLERQLSEAKALLRGGSTTVEVGDGISAAELREWARHNGIECPPVGRVPNSVREAFEADRQAAS